MLQGYNILEYYETQDLQRWGDLENKDATFVFETNVIPPFFLVSTEFSLDSATVQVFDVNNNAIGTAKSVTQVNNTTYMSYKYLGETISGADCGNYYLKIVNGTNIFYSEVFRWEDDIDDYLKITVETSDLTMGSVYTLDISDITFECYVEAEETLLEPDINEEGVEQPFGDIPVFNTLNITHGFEIFGSRAMLRFLSGLRILETNGSVVFGFGGAVFNAYDITVEKGDIIGNDDTVMFTLKFKENNYISSKNV